MGMPTGMSSSKTSATYEVKKVSKFDPNPAKFEIIRRLARNENVALIVNYPNCTNYEGNKIMVYRGVDPSYLYGQKELDPHFTEKENIIKPFARFEPTEQGWMKAVMLLDVI
jgi:hypothetical protein